jgi:hypothetical protein
MTSDIRKVFESGNLLWTLRFHVTGWI